MPPTLAASLDGQDTKLSGVLQGIADAVADIAGLLRSIDVGEVGGTNTFGDRQLKADVATDDVIVRHLRASTCVAAVSSEEHTDTRDLGGDGYAVAYDPLDGSSILSANFAVGTIFGVWPGRSLHGVRGRELAAAAYAVYGPRVLLVLARPVAGAPGHTVQEFVHYNGAWFLHRNNIRVQEQRVVAPANARAVKENSVYRDLLTSWLESGMKLRYSGGLVPDVHHILANGGGVFVNPGSASAPAKLRSLYECAPIAFVVEAAGGASHDGQGSVLDQTIADGKQRTLFACGSLSLVEASIPSLQYNRA